MNPQDQNNQQSGFSLNRDTGAGMAGTMPAAQIPMQAGGMPSQTTPQGAPQMELPFSAFPANIARQYDPGISEIVFDLVERKYRPNAYIERMQQKGIQIDENMQRAIRESSGPDVSEAIRDFEVARVYSKLEIEIYEMSRSQLSPEKRQELEQLTAQAGANPGQNQAEIVTKIRGFMQENVPNISQLVDQYMNGFVNQYLAGRF